MTPQLPDLIIFDLDGTLIEHPIGGRFRQKGMVDDWAIRAGVREVCAYLHQQGVVLAIATNQGAVAFGMFRAADLYAEILRAAAELGIQDRLVQVCYDHPKATIEAYRRDSERRKPNPGMLLDICRSASANPARALFVGDMESDRQAAENAGCMYMDQDEFFSDTHLRAIGMPS